MKALRAEVDTADERLRAILASVNDCYFTLDQGYRITDLNRSAIDWVGPTQSQVLGACLWDLCDPGAECSRVIQEGMERRRRIRREVISGLRPGRWIDLQVSPSADGLSVFFTDVTERRSATEALEELSGRFLNLQDEERQRIAEELHDSTAQLLVAAGLNLMRLKQYVSPGDGGQVLDETANLVEEAAREVRAFTYLLHPPSLENEGLAGTVQTFAAGFAHRTGLEIPVRMPETANYLPLDVQRSLLRIVQETLTNVYRHAMATRVVIDLRLGRGALKLRILDDGCGLPRGVRMAASNGPLLGVGVTGMRARLLRFGGDMKLLSDRRGTLVVATLPLLSISPGAPYCG
jgi:PAS domain S-box-containing protein